MVRQLNDEPILLEENPMGGTVCVDDSTVAMHNNVVYFIYPKGTLVIICTLQCNKY